MGAEVEYDPSFHVAGTLPESVQAEIKAKVMEKLTEMLGMEVDDVIAQYVLVMVGNHKNMQDIGTALVDFIGEESSTDFIKWFAAILYPYHVALSSEETADMDEQVSSRTDSAVSANDKVCNDADKSATKPRMISLKGVHHNEGGSKTGNNVKPGLKSVDLRSVINSKRKNSEGPMKDGLSVSSKADDLRSLISSKRAKNNSISSTTGSGNGKPSLNNNAMDKKTTKTTGTASSAEETRRRMEARAKRFGIAVDSTPGGDSGSRDANNPKGKKSVKDSQQGQGRDTLSRRPKQNSKDGSRDEEEGEIRTKRKPGSGKEYNDREKRRKGNSKGPSGSHGYPPMPGMDMNMGMGMGMGMAGPFPWQPFPPGMMPHGAYPFPPRGGHRGGGRGGGRGRGSSPHGSGDGFFPPYGMPPPLYGYPGYFPSSRGGRGPRGGSFNKKWVKGEGNGETPGADSENNAASNASSTTKTSTKESSDGSTFHPPAFGAASYGMYTQRAPPRPRFGNKTWVRPDATTTSTTEQDSSSEKLSASLPTTPPPADNSN